MIKPPEIDPTLNVVALSEASNKRQDDLRDSATKLMEAELRHIQFVMALRSQHYAELNSLESSRLNANRQFDATAVNTAADRAQVAITALAAVTASNAENLRTALANTATTIATQLSVTVSAINERLAALEKSSYEGKGRQSYSDPALTELAQQMKTLTEFRANREGKTDGSTALWGFIVGGLGLATAIISILLSLHH